MEKPRPSFWKVALRLFVAFFADDGLRKLWLSSVILSAVFLVDLCYILWAGRYDVLPRFLPFPVCTIAVAASAAFLYRRLNDEPVTSYYMFWKKGGSK